MTIDLNGPSQGPKDQQLIATPVRAWVTSHRCRGPKDRQLKGPSTVAPSALRILLTTNHALTGVAISCRPFGPEPRTPFQPGQPRTPTANAWAKSILEQLV